MAMVQAPRRILVVRNDKLGDFMLSWPALRLLKETLPAAEVSVLVTAYTRPMAERCPWIDKVLVDPRAPGLNGAVALARRLREHHYDAAVTLFSTAQTGLALWLAGIKHRFAPATKIAQLFYNHRIRQRRSRSEKPEFQYNLDLAGALLQACGLDPATPPQPPFLLPDQAAVAAGRARLLEQLGLAAHGKLVFVHPGSGGSARNLRLDQYQSLCRALQSPHPLGFVITAGPGELAAAEQVAAGLAPLPHTVVAPPDLAELSRTIALADLYISGSTGPLHIAGALDRPTAAFYPAHRSGCALRWQTLNSAERRLAFSPPAGGDPTDVSRTDVAAAAREISARYLR